PSKEQNPPAAGSVTSRRRWSGSSGVVWILKDMDDGHRRDACAPLSAAGDGGDEDDLVVGFEEGGPVAEVAIAGAAEGTGVERQPVSESQFLVKAAGGASEG